MVQRWSAAVGVAGLISCASWSVVGVSGAVGELSIVDPRVTTCASNVEKKSYRDTASLQCATCDGTGELVYNTDLGGGCTCGSGYKRVYNGFALEYFSCQACSSPTLASSADRLSCQSCGSSTSGYQISSGECACSGAKEVLVKESPVGVSLSTQECLVCASTERKVGNTCVACTPPKVWIANNSTSDGGSCSCPSGLAAGIFCENDPADAAAVRVGFSASALASVQFYDIFNPRTEDHSGRTRTVSSAYLTAYLVDAADKCQFNFDSVACQHLANMCVMTGYDLTSVACELHAASQKALTTSKGVVNNIAGWPTYMPWIFYAESPASVYADTGIDLILTLGSRAGSGSYVNALQFKIARYNAKGNFLGVVDVAGHLESCSRTYKEKVSWHSIGVSYLSECSESFSRLITLFPDASTATLKTEQEFWDFYLEIDDNPDSPTIYPVPVKVLGLKAADGNFVNDDSSTDNDVLVRRFMPYDTISGRTALETDPAVVRYMKSVTLTITGSKDNPSKILAPVLEIEYANVELSFVSTSTPIKLEVIYDNNLDAFWTAVIIVFSLCGVVALVVTVPRVYLYMQKTRNTQMRFDLFVHAILAFGDSMADAGLVGLLAFSTYMFITYKFGASFTPMPRQEQSRPLLIIIIVGTCFKAMWVLLLLYDQCNVDLFFIDWERRPLQEEDALREALTAKSQIRTRDRQFIDDEDQEREREEWAKEREAAREAMQLAGNLDDLGRKKGIPGVSTWRKVFVANEWTELSSFRKFNPLVTAILTLAFLEGLKLKHLATYSTDITSTDPGIVSPILRFFVDVVFFWGITQAQRLYFFAIYYRYFGEPTDRFVDCLALTNISVLFLDTSKLHGYYLHGRSPADADVDLPTVLERLRDYETGLGVGRGLLASAAISAPHAAVASRDGDRDPSENQCFEVFLSAHARQMYEGAVAKVLQDYTKDSVAMTGKLGSNVAVGTGMREVDTSSVFASSSLPMSVKEELVKTTTTLWKTFIERITSQAGSAVREMNFFMERTGIPPAEANLGAGVGENEEQHSLLFHDFVERWCSTLLIGIEHNLNLLDTLIFATFDYVWGGNLFVACTAVFVVDLFIRTLRRILGDANIASKPDVPERYILT